MFMVTGGKDDGGVRLDSTETFDPLVGSWTASGAKLPRPLSGISAEIINDSVLLFGNNLLSSSDPGPGPGQVKVR